MNKQEIIDEINKTKEHLANMEKMLKECDERWKPEKGEEYFYVDNVGIIQNALFDNTMGYHLDLCKTLNCFKTKKQAELEAEKILVRRQLEDIARRLNRGVKIDWHNDDQYKYCFIYDVDYQHINQDSNINVIRQGAVYCLDKNFLNTAIKEIGEGRLIKYLRGE